MTPNFSELAQKLLAAGFGLRIAHHSARARLVLGRPLVILVAFVVLAACAPTMSPDNLRILTYNTAFMYLQADATGPPPGPPCLTSCNPLELPPAPFPCYCSSISWQVNRYKFADIEESTRAQKIAERILATDQDVVVLNEVFDPQARSVFVLNLAQLGPYKHYISLLRGHAPVDFSSIGQIPGAPDFLTDLPDFLLPYHPINNDSGLMIFSKYPFLELTGSSVPNDAGCSGSECQFDGMNNGSALQPGFFAFKVFDLCGTFDCLASKGVGLVKIGNPRGASFVAFTHLQSEDDEWPARKSQYETIRKVITGAIPALELPQAPVYLVGDLNTSGCHRESDQGSAGQEWHDLFNPASNNPNVADGFFACGNGVKVGPTMQLCRYGTNGMRLLTDSWGFETSTTDEGINGRLDYILHSTRMGRLCMQHIMRAWDLQADAEGDGGAVWLSDHFPIRGDFGLTGRWCSPNDDPDQPDPDRKVRLLEFGPTNCTPSGAGGNPICDQEEQIDPPEARISSAGNFQWFLIDQAGTYSIRLTSADPTKKVDYMVYHHTDLSRPILPFDEHETEWGVIYSMPDPPFYIRTFAIDQNGRPDRTAKGRDYSLKVHQHLCREPIDACVLEPGLARSAPYLYVWPNTQWNDPLTEVSELWWRFKTSGVKNGKLVAGANSVAFPKVRMQIEASTKEKYKCITTKKPVVEVWDDPFYPSQLVQQIGFADVSVDDDKDWDDDGAKDDLSTAPDLPADVDGEFKIYFLKVTRDSSFQDQFNVCNEGMTSWVSYLTDLTYFVPLRVKMWAELDDDLGAADNMRIHMGYDATGFKSYPPTGPSVDKSFDEPDQTDLHGYSKLQGYYINQVWPTFWEMDEEEFLTTWGVLGPFHGITSLSAWERAQSEAFLILADGPNGDEADYYYYFYYAMCHMENVPACANPNVPTP
jgi:endonuclease/exonuclease/phosphatase family metal-dependent hydrolase